MSKNPPPRIYWVRRIPPSTERRRVYAPSLTRTYTHEGHMKAFLESNKDSTFEIFVTETDWKEAQP